MLYVQESLAQDEELIHVGKFHWMYTLHAFSAILWGLLMSILILFGATLFYKQTGKFPPDIGWFSAIPYLHPGIRIAAFIAFVFGLLSFAQQMVVKATTEIAVTDKRMIYKRGLVARQVGEISIDRIEGVNVMQSILGRIFDYGRVAVRGMGVGEVVLPPIENPVIFRKAIEKARTL